MKELLYKEFKLAKHPTMLIFWAFALMLLIPSYPYYIAYMYTCLSVFFVFITGRENRDIEFTASLPVRRRDVVKARCCLVALMELSQILVSIPFAALTLRINPNPGGNMAGIEANVAFFGLVFVMYALFNVIFLPSFYKTAVKAGWALLFGGGAVLLYILIMELLVRIPLFTGYLDAADPAGMVRQIPVLIGGILIFIALNVLAFHKSAKNFERAEL